MCGILSVVNFRNKLSGINLSKASAIIKHRGPDDEGFLTWQPGEQPVICAGNDTALSTRNHWQYPDLDPGQSFKVGFAHRRLSILDLTPAGHQPMLYQKARLAITYNGEVYNYLEIKAELEKVGHKFITASDTEVILHAWEEWGPDCLNDFNGMFAFVILDYEKQELYAVRDRFGVKPLYYYAGANAFYFASEIKQIRTSPDYTFSLNETIARQYLAAGVADHNDDTFETGIKSLTPGFYIRIDLSSATCKPELTKWYYTKARQWHGNFETAADKFRRLLTDAVRLRLRSDVKVGSCLSGGLDSSSIVCIAADLLKADGNYTGQETVTACYDDAKYDEWNFAQEVIKKTNAQPHRVFPSFRQLQEEMDTFLWHQDEPVGSSSVYSQWAVFKKTHEAGLKVMIDGQGADEQLAGYGGNDVPLYAGLLAKMKLFALYDEAWHYKKEKGTWPYGFLLAALQLNSGKTIPGLLPEKYRIKKTPDVDWLQPAEPSGIYSWPAHDLQENLYRQLHTTPLPALLRYEDHNSMAWSVESRTPFMDYRLIEFNAGLPERFIYKRGVRKNILRQAMHGIIPEAIENRRDKMGFVTPEEVWLKGEGKEWFNDSIDKACKQFGGHLLDAGKVRKYVDEMIAGKREFDFMPWRIVCFYRWFKRIVG